MNGDIDDARKDALAFLKHHVTGVLATVSGEHNVHASMVYYTSDNDFNIYILMLVTTRKFKALQAHPQVAFTISSAEIPRTLQIEGMAMDISLDEEAKEKRKELFDLLNVNPWFYGPVTKLDPAEAVVVWIRPTWIRWADYAFAEAGNDKVFKEIPISS